MDASRFDNLTRALTRARSRRSLIRVLGGAVAGLLSRGEVAAHCLLASNDCKFKSDCCSGVCVYWDGEEKSIGNRCPSDERCQCKGNGDWSNECQNAANCEKKHGTAWSKEWKCDKGWCLFKCGEGWCRAGEICFNLSDGPKCYHRCTDGAKCHYTRSWTADGLCARGICFPTPYVGARCHDFGPDCLGGAVCTAGAGKWGVCRCRSGQTVCGEGKNAYCSDLNSDKANCGKCGAKCPNDPNIRCSQGRCVCPTGQTLCGTGDAARCRDLQTDLFHCGRCSRACLTQFQRCKNGTCCNLDGVACPEGCGPGGRCKGCCSGVCRLDGTCGTISQTECLATHATCPSGCTPQKPCPGCCDRTCNASGMCSPQGCAFGTQPCDDNTPCCSSGPLDGDGAFICKDTGGPSRVCWWN
jgi:hypothetical protein